MEEIAGLCKERSVRRSKAVRNAYSFILFICALFAVGSQSFSAGACDGDMSASLAGYGDLRVSEVNQIQSVVDKLGREIVVVGSAARGTRRNLGTDLPLRKGERGRSDIDYVLPTSQPYEFDAVAFFTRDHEALLKTLPDLDSKHFVLTKELAESRSRVWCRPYKPPVRLAAFVPNLEVQPWLSFEDEAELLSQKILELRHLLEMAKERSYRPTVAQEKQDLAKLQARQHALYERRLRTQRIAR